ncbi:BMC domain-containing protein [Clostridium sp.]|jgi:ethanolamine utilization protein EutM|uniref:BMC domain-containing protein n=1 Tax=Clostridium sp. TaxID=1506 RepID=UPI003EEBBD94
MIKLSLGIIETVGLVAAIAAADVALKTANVYLIGYEISKGDGLVTVKIQGDVSAVNAAIKSAKVSAAKVNTVLSTTVIARPDEKLVKLIITDETVGLERSNENLQKDKPSVKEEINIEDTYEVSEEIDKIDKINIEDIDKSEEIDEINIQDIEETKATCNLCMDPACPRKKGDPRNACIHHN